MLCFVPLCSIQGIFVVSPVSGFFGCSKFNKYWDWMVWMVQVERHQMEVGTKCSCLQELIKYLYFFILENWKIYEQEHSMSWCNHKHSWSKIHYNIWSSTPVTRAEISLGPLRKEKSRQLLQKKLKKWKLWKAFFTFLAKACPVFRATSSNSDWSLLDLMMRWWKYEIFFAETSFYSKKEFYIDRLANMIFVKSFTKVDLFKIQLQYFTPILNFGISIQW